MTSLDQLIDQVEAAIAAHHRGETAPFSARLLGAVHEELDHMRTSDAFDPTYARFVLDWPDASSALGKALMDAAYARHKALRRHG